MGILSKTSKLFSKYPVTRGMLMYSLTWPTANLVQQTFNGKSWNTYDWKEALRFSAFGSIYVAPTLHGWIKITSLLWKQSTVKTAIYKTGLEQLTYGPFAALSFLYLTNLMEGKSHNKCLQEVQLKFLPTWQTAICYWPIIQMVNYTVIPERNRVVFVSIGSFVWIIFLAYMKHLKEEELTTPKKIANPS